MGHRQLFNPFEAENDQSWNPVEQPYMHIAPAGVADNSNLIYPMDNMSIDGAQYASHCNPAPMPNGYSSAVHNVEIPHYQHDASGSSQEHFLHASTAGSFYTIPENYGHHASSSNYGGQTFHRTEGDFFDLTVGNGRGQYKRKSPAIPAVCERDGTSRYHDSGGSSDLSMPSNLWQEKPSMDFLHTPWDYPTMNPNYRGNNLSIGGEGTLRNVRSRAALNLEANLARTHLSDNMPHHSYTTSQPTDVSHSVDLLGQSSNVSSREWNQTHIPSAAHDNSVLNHEINHLIRGSSNPSPSIEIGGHNNDLITRSNHVPQNFQGTSAQSVRAVRSSYIQRPAPTFGASSSSLRFGHAVASDEGLQLATENYSSRHPRPLSNLGWHASDLNGRTRMSSERYRSFSDDTSFHDRLAPEGLMIVDRSAYYGSRNPFDQHREMRLDIDHMSYEELLALGERIGNVSTGLSEDLISKCLRESIYCSSDQIQEEGTCVICLEEYVNMDDIGMLRACGHDFHVCCIRKWLSLKNLCPICKFSALGDRKKHK